MDTWNGEGRAFVGLAMPASLAACVRLYDLQVVAQSSLDCSRAAYRRLGELVP
jgi:hypothetical protein